MSRLRVQLERKRRETPWLLVLSALIFVLSFAFNLWTWGALVQVKVSGPLIERNASLSAPLAWTYLKLGGAATTLLGASSSRAESVSEDFSASLPKIEADPEKAIELVLADRSSSSASLLPISYYASPVALVLWILFTWIRPRQRHTFNVNP